MAKLQLKVGVEPRMLYILTAVANVAAELKDPTSVTITAGIDGVHTPGSKHYQLAALDVRSHNFPPIAKTIFLKAVLARLGTGYQGFLESAGTPDEHWHIEFDPY